MAKHLILRLVCNKGSLFTGTTERVCLIQGTVEALNAVHGFIAEKIREMPQNVAKTEPVSILQPQTTVNPDRIKQVSFLLRKQRHVSCLELTAFLRSLKDLTCKESTLNVS